MVRMPTWRTLSKTRGELYGLAILSIIVFHYFEGVTDGPLYTTAKIYNTLIGSIGVDVFVFLSGFCICHSLSMEPPLGRFYARRLRRVLFPYLIIGLLFWGFKDLVVLHLPIERFLCDYSFVSFWLEGVRTVWYVPFILLMYLASPLVWRVLKIGVPSIVLAAAWLVGCIAVRAVAPVFYAHTEIALMRAPLFFLGMGCGNLAGRDPRVPPALLAALPLFAAFKIYAELVQSPFMRVANGLYGCSLIAAYLFLHETIKRWLGSGTREDPAPLPCDGLLRKVGALSYELYLSHVLLRNILITLGVNLAIPLDYLACIAASVPAALALAQLQRIGEWHKG